MYSSMKGSIPWQGFIEPSEGIEKLGFAVRGQGLLRLKPDAESDFCTLTCNFVRPTPDWPLMRIKVKINSKILGVIQMKEMGENEKVFKIGTLPNNCVLNISFQVEKNRILHWFKAFFTQNEKKQGTRPLARDALLIKKISLDDRILLDYNSECSRIFPANETNFLEKPISVIGFFRQSFGLAEACRRTTYALRAAQIPHNCVQAPFTGKHKGLDNSIEMDAKHPGKHDKFRLFHFNGDHAEIVAKKWSEDVFSTAYSIGFWHWELPVFPDEYLNWFSRVDEVWTPSNFVRDAIGKKSPVPTLVFPLCVDEKVFNPPQADKSAFNLPTNKFLFLISFDFYSSMERKNPIDAIRAFALLIQTQVKPVHLVIKTSNAHADRKSAKKLHEQLDSLPSNTYTIIEDTFPRKDFLKLINTCDALLSLHRSEGFGLHLAEAMAMGKPTLATNWSGNVDFMDETNAYPVNYRLVELKDNHGPYAKGSYWADPDIEHAVSQIRLLLEKEQNVETQLKRAARTTILKRHSPERVGGLIRERLLGLERLRRLGDCSAAPFPKDK